MKALYLTFVMPEEVAYEVVAKDIAMPIQTQLFAKRSIKIFSECFDEFKVISYYPVSNFPRFRKVLFKSEEFIIENVNVSALSFVNIFLLKHITRFISLVFTIFLKRKNDKFDCVIVHGVHSPYLIFAKMHSFLYKSKLIVIFTDPPGVIRKEDGNLAKFFKKLDSYIVSKIIKGNSFIALSDKIGEKFFSAQPNMVIDGFIDKSNNIIISERNKDDSYIDVLYAGMLDERYGIKQLVDSVKLLPSNVRMNLCGRGDLEEYIKTLESSQLKYHGFLEKKDLDSIYQNVDILINPRPTSDEYTKYSFPSKLLEYLSYGIPTITTKLPSITSDIKPFFNYIENESPEGIADIIIETTNNLEKLKLKAKEAQKYVKNTRNFESYFRKCRDFFQIVIEKVN